MSRRYLLVASSAASLGYLVGFLAGAAVRDLASLRTARRTRTGLGAPQPAFGHTETPEPRIGAHSGVQPPLLDLDDDELDAFTAAVKGHGEPCTCNDIDSEDRP